VCERTAGAGGGAARRCEPQTRAKQNQANPNKSKQKGLDLLGFIRPNRIEPFQWVAAEKNNKIFSVSPHCAKRLKLLRHPFSSPPVRETGFDSAMD
jgi:hypothetical protein